MATFAFIDAANLFYGGEKSLGWKVDYKKLAAYLKSKYCASRMLYFGGIEVGTFKYDYLQNETVPLGPLEKYERLSLQEAGASKGSSKAQILLIARNLKRIQFYLRLEKFGYELYLKPVKVHKQEGGATRKKANCDVDLAFFLMKEVSKYERVLVLSGDGDFLPVLKHLKIIGKEVIILSRANRTAREIKKFAGNNFRDFTCLEYFIN